MGTLREKAKEVAARGLYVGLEGAVSLYEALDDSATSGNKVSYRARAALDRAQSLAARASERVIGRGFKNPEDQSLTARFVRKASLGTFAALDTFFGILRAHPERVRYVEGRRRENREVDTAIREQVFSRLTGEARLLTEELLADGLDPINFFEASNLCSRLIRDLANPYCEKSPRHSTSQFSFGADGTVCLEGLTVSPHELAQEIADLLDMPCPNMREALQSTVFPPVHGNANRLLRWIAAAAKDEPEILIGFRADGTDAEGRLIIKENIHAHQPGNSFDFWKLKLPGRTAATAAPPPAAAP